MTEPVEDDDLLAISGLQHLAFCARQWALIHLEQQWEDNAETLKGEFFHERVDITGYTSSRGFRAERRVHVRSLRLGLYGIADIVEYGIVGDADIVRPIEYKVGKPKVEDWDRIQVTAQALCLEEMTGTAINEAALFYGKTRHREAVLITDTLRRTVEMLSERAHSIFSTGKTPLPEGSPRCFRCSLRNVCEPEIARRDVHEYWRDHGIDLGGGQL